MAKDSKKAEQAKRKAAQAATLEREENLKEMEALAYESFQINPELYID